MPSRTVAWVSISDRWRIVRRSPVRPEAVTSARSQRSSQASRRAGSIAPSDQLPVRKGQTPSHTSAHLVIQRRRAWKSFR